MDIAGNIETIKKKLPKGVKLVAVSKTKPNPDILEAYHAGHKIFGENKVQDLVHKYEQLPKDIEWHLEVGKKGSGEAGEGLSGGKERNETRKVRGRRALRPAGEGGRENKDKGIE
jgi:hypothetical protein